MNLQKFAIIDNFRQIYFLGDFVSFPPKIPIKTS